MTTRNTPNDTFWMQQAINQAEQAKIHQEIPVGAIVVLNNTSIVGVGYNCPITNNDPTAHAEIIAIRAAAETLKNYRLPNTTVYVTLEPCLMCLGAMLHARIERLVFGAYDLNRGIISNILNLSETLQTNPSQPITGFFPAPLPKTTNPFSPDKYNHMFPYQGGIMHTECSKLLIDFFKTKR